MSAERKRRSRRTQTRTLETDMRRRRLNTKAGQWVREHHPDLWAQWEQEDADEHR